MSYADNLESTRPIAEREGFEPKSLAADTTANQANTGNGANLEREHAWACRITFDAESLESTRPIAEREGFEPQSLTADTTANLPTNGPVPTSPQM
jgi:hypothetical protein